MKLIDMKNADPDQDQEEMSTPTPSAYPYGLQLSLDEEVMAKLGIKALPAVGQKMVLQATVEVCATSQYDSKEGEPSQNVSLQITAMGLESMKTQADHAKKLYGKE